MPRGTPGEWPHSPLLLAFGSLYAMVVPIVTALFALAFGLSVVGLLSAWIPIGTSAPVVC